MADDPNFENIPDRPNIARLAESDPLSTEDLYNMQHPALPQRPAPSPELQAYMEQLHPTLPSVQKSSLLQPGYDPGSLGDMWNKIQFQGAEIPVDIFQTGKRVKADFRNPKLSSQFYERYSNHPDFDELGFSPFRDNETLYNEHASWWNEMQRAAGQWATLAGLGFKDAMGFGDLTDPENARKFEEAMAIGSSSKGGVGGFTTNLFLNSGYTVGIMLELGLEELAMALGEAGLAIAAPFTGGATVAGNIALGARMSARALEVGGKLKSAVNVGKTIAKSLENIQDISKARKFFEASAKSIGNFVNPLENTVDFFRAAKDMKVSNWVKTYRGFGSFYKDVRTIRLAFSEASLEGGMVQNEMVDSLYENFVKQNGRPPNEDESNALREQAIIAGRTTALLNMPAIYFSDKLMFDGLVTNRYKRLYTGEVSLPGTMEKGIFRYKKGKPVLEEIAPTRWGRTKQLMRDPKRMLGKALTYTEANISEGIQESLQDVISGASKAYYTDEFLGSPTRGGYMNYVGEALSNQMSAQGMETFLSGFLMGGLIRPMSSGMSAIMHGKEGLKETRVVKGASYINDQFKRLIWDKEKYSDYRKTQQESRDQEIQKGSKKIALINQWFDDPTHYLSPDLHGLSAQKMLNDEMVRAAKEGREMDFHDYKDQAQYEAISTVLTMNRMPETIKRMEDMKDLTEEEIQKSYNGMSKKEFDFIIDTSINRAKQIQHAWNVASKRKNPYNPNAYKNDRDRYITELLGQRAWNQAISEMVFQQFSFKRYLERNTALLEEFQKVTELDKIPASAFTPLFSSMSTQNEIEQLESAIKSFGETGPTEPSAKKLYDEKKKQLELLKVFKSEAMDAELQLNTKKEVSPETRKKLLKAYSDYITTLTKVHKDYTTNDAIKRSLDKLIDAYYLESKAQAANEAVNTLMDPAGFEAAHQKHLAINKARYENRRYEVEASLKAFNNLAETNKMLQALADKGMFIDPKDLGALETKGEMPPIYSIAAVESKKEEIFVLSDQYNQAVAIFKDFLSKEGISLQNLRIFEAAADPYGFQVRKKDPTDKRSYEALAKQFGFDPEKPETTLELPSVLRAVINSPHATDYDKELALELLKIASDKETVTFVKNAATASSYTESRQTVVDARYSASDYVHKGTPDYPIEYLILHAELQRRLIQIVKDDTEFRKTAEELMKEAFEGWNALPEKERTRIAKRSTNEAWKGFASVVDFVTEAATNEEFQNFLAGVKSKITVEPKSVWKNFIDAVLKRLAKIFTTAPSGTVLNSTLNLLSTRIGAGPTVAATAQATTLSRALSVEQLMLSFPEQGRQILEAFKKRNKERVEDGNDPLLPGYDKLSDSEILASGAFATYFKDPDNSSVTDIINAAQKPKPQQPQPKKEAPFKEKVDLSVEPEEPSQYPLVSEEEYQEFQKTGDVTQVRAVILHRKNGVGLTTYEAEMVKAPAVENRIAKIRKDLEILKDPKLKPSQITSDMKTALRDLGYGPVDFKLLKGRVSEVVTIIAEGLTKEQRIELGKRPVKAQKEPDHAKAIQILQEIIDIGVAQGTKQSVLMAIDQISYVVKQDADLYSGIEDLTTVLKEMFVKAFNKISHDLSLSKFRKGDLVFMKNEKVLARVKRIGENYLVVEYETNGKEEKIMMNKNNNFEDRIKYRDSEELEAVESMEDAPVEVTPEQKEVHEEAEKIMGGEDLLKQSKQAVEESKTMETKQTRQELIDNLEFKCKGGVKE